MRVMKLEFEAFGPFAERQIIDFAEASSEGLLLISGRTGAGKSSILDAICFALYGRVPRYDGRPERVRSDHAETHQPTEVSLEFELNGQGYKIVRSPKWEKPKKGGGIREIGHAAQLWRMKTNGEWEGIASRPTDVAAEVAQILPLSADQFLQVILLSQGGFQRFLEADPQDRQKTLRTLFKTDVFERVEIELDEKRKTAEQHLKTVNAQADALESELIAALEEDELNYLETQEPESEQALSEEATTEIDFNVRLAILQEEHRRQQKAATEAKHRSEDAQRAYDAAKAIDQLWRRRQEARDTLLRLDAENDDIASARVQLQLAQRAEHVVPYISRRVHAFDRVQSIQTLTSRAYERHDQAQAALHEFEPHFVDQNTESPEPVKPDLGLVQDTIETVVARIASLEVELGRENQVHELKTALNTHTDNLTKLSQERLSATEKLSSLPATMAELRNSISKLTVHASSLDRQNDDLATVQAQLKAATEAENTRNQLKTEQDSLTSYANQAAAASAHLADLIQRRIAGMAGELAADLAAGQPCPVCGAKEHPHPATSEISVSAEDVEEAQEEAQQSERRRDEQHARVTTAEKKLAELEATSKHQSPGELQEALNTAELALEDTQQAATKLASAQAELAAQEELQNELQLRAESLNERISKLTSEKDRLEANLESTEASLAHARGRWESVAKRVSSLGEYRQVLVALRDVLNERVEAESKLQTAQNDEDEALAQHEFKDAESALEAERAQPVREEIEQRILQHDRQRAIAESVISEPEIRGLPEENSNLTESECHLNQARSREQELANAAHTLGEKISHRKSQLSRLQTLRDTNSQVEESFYQLRQLTDAVRGNEPNTKRMRLEAYVLAGRLEAIVEAANQRFAHMSDGRYRLEHDDSIQARRKQSGLGLTVFDAYTGKSRSTASLSGGETFLASMSLALGLADVVTGEVGGINLDTLFIDEGFGSLDPESLEQALEMLDSLRQGGRAVAAISHVREMHERIPKQLEVVASAFGPSTLRGAGVKTGHIPTKDVQ